MIKRLLRNLRQQPKGVRDNIALGIAVVFTSMVAFGWLYSLPMRVADRTGAATAEEQPGFTALFKGIKDQVAGVKEAITTDVAPASADREVIDEEYQVVMPQAALQKNASPAVTTVAATTTATTTESWQDRATSSTVTLEPVRSIRIVTTNTAASSSTATSTP